jgi:hypothetical protein
VPRQSRSRRRGDGPLRIRNDGEPGEESVGRALGEWASGGTKRDTPGAGQPQSQTPTPERDGSTPSPATTDDDLAREVESQELREQFERDVADAAGDKETLVAIGRDIARRKEDLLPEDLDALRQALKEAR